MGLSKGTQVPGRTEGLSPGRVASLLSFHVGGARRGRSTNGALRRSALIRDVARERGRGQNEPPCLWQEEGVCECHQQAASSPPPAWSWKQALHETFMGLYGRHMAVPDSVSLSQHCISFSSFSQAPQGPVRGLQPSAGLGGGES